MIVLSVALDQVRLEILANLGEDRPQVADGEFRQGVFAVFGDEDQMRVECVNDVATSTSFGVIRHVALR